MTCLEIEPRLAVASLSIVLLVASALLDPAIDLIRERLDHRRRGRIAHDDVSLAPEMLDLIRVQHCLSPQRRTARLPLLAGFKLMSAHSGPVTFLRFSWPAGITASTSI